MARPRKYKDEEERYRAQRGIENRAVKKYYEDKQRIHTTFTKEEYARISDAAKRNGISPTRYVKEAALIRVEKEQEPKKGGRR